MGTDEKQKLDKLPTISPVWCAAANVREFVRLGVDGQETRKGTKYFHAGAKVYCCPPPWDWFWTGCVFVIGHYRGRNYIKIVMPAYRLTNWRVELVYSPKVIALLIRPYFEGSDPWPNWDGSERSRAEVEEFVQRMRKQDEELRGRSKKEHSLLVWPKDKRNR